MTPYAISNTTDIPSHHFKCQGFIMLYICIVRNINSTTP